MYVSVLSLRKKEAYKEQRRGKLFKEANMKIRIQFRPFGLRLGEMCTRKKIVILFAKNIFEILQDAAEITTRF